VVTVFHRPTCWGSGKEKLGGWLPELR
jgi:hypothetical protein